MKLFIKQCLAQVCLVSVFGTQAMQQYNLEIPQAVEPQKDAVQTKLTCEQVYMRAKQFEKNKNYQEAIAFYEAVDACSDLKCQHPLLRARALTHLGGIYVIKAESRDGYLALRALDYFQRALGIAANLDRNLVMRIMYDSAEIYRTHFFLGDQTRALELYSDILKSQPSADVKAYVGYALSQLRSLHFPWYFPVKEGHTSWLDTAQEQADSKKRKELASEQEDTQGASKRPRVAKQEEQKAEVEKLHNKS